MTDNLPSAQEKTTNVGRKTFWTEPVKSRFLEILTRTGTYSKAIREIRGDDDVKGPGLNLDSLWDARQRDPEFEAKCREHIDQYFLGNQVEDIVTIRPHIKLLSDDAVIWEEVDDPDNPGQTKKIPIGTRLSAKDINALAAASAKLSSTRPKSDSERTETVLTDGLGELQLTDAQTLELAAKITSYTKVKDET